MAGERTEQATSHRREQARKDGDLLHSRELSSAAGSLAGTLTLGFLLRRSLETWKGGFQGFLALSSAARWEQAQLGLTLLAIRGLICAFLAPFAAVLLASAVAALGVGMLQTGGVSLAPAAVGLRLDRINPLANLKNLFSVRAAGRLGKSLIPAAFLTMFASAKLAHQFMVPPLSLSRITMLGDDAYGLLLTSAWILFGWSAIDYLVEWRSRESRLKMSREDLRQEYKETEGSPQIRSRIRGLQRQMRRRKVKNDIGRAAVVLTNPTHFAVALAFDFVDMQAPKVLAKGRNLLAEEIKTEARWAGVPIVENPPLARSLYRSVEVGQAIPFDRYAAVAAILAYLYRQRVEREAREQRAREAAASATPANHGSALKNRGAGMDGRMR